MDLQLLDTLLTISALLQRDMARYFSGSGLTESRVGVLWVLQTGGPSTQQAIASALGVSPRNVSGLVDALESDGFVRRAEHPSDRRAVLVELTARSSEFMARMQREHDELNSALLAAVAPADLPAFERGIDAVTRRLREVVLASEARNRARPMTEAEAPTGVSPARSGRARSSTGRGGSRSAS